MATHTLETRQLKAPATPTVSVIMAVYNGDRFLREAVDSVLAQTFTDFELVVVDDGSTDQSPAMLDSYAASDERVVLLRQENQGLTKSLNTAIAAARGKYLARMDGDDICLPERFAKQVAFLDSHPEVALVGTGMHSIDASGDRLGTRRLESDHAKLDAAHMLGGSSLVHPSIMVRAAAMAQIGGYAEQYRTSQDLDLFLRLAEVGTLTNLTEPLLLYRWHDDNISVRKADQQDRDVTAIVAAAHRRRGLDPPRSMPRARWQFRRVMALKYRRSGQRRQAARFALQAVRMRPLAPRSWYTLFRTLAV
ncbi:MAG: glycosyltransferase [Planctomycetota bacterium]